MEFESKHNMQRILICGVFLLLQAGWGDITTFKSSFANLERTNSLDFNYGFQGNYYKNKLKLKVNTNSNNKVVQSGSRESRDERLGLTTSADYLFWKKKNGRIGLNANTGQTIKKTGGIKLSEQNEIFWGGKFSVDPIKKMSFSSNFGPLNGNEQGFDVSGGKISSNTSYEVNRRFIPFYKSGDNAKLNYSNSISLKKQAGSTEYFKDLVNNISVSLQKKLSDTTSVATDFSGSFDDDDLYDPSQTGSKDLKPKNHLRKQDYKAGINLSTKLPYDIDVGLDGKLGINFLKYSTEIDSIKANLARRDNSDSSFEWSGRLGKTLVINGNPLKLHIAYTYKNFKQLKSFNNFIQNDKNLRLSYSIGTFDFSYAAGLFRNDTPDENNFLDQDKFVSKFTTKTKWAYNPHLSGDVSVSLDFDKISFWSGKRSANNNLTTKPGWHLAIKYSPLSMVKFDQSFNWKGKMIQYDFGEKDDPDKDQINTDLNTNTGVALVLFENVDIKYKFSYKYFTNGNLKGQMPVEVINEISRLEETFVNNAGLSIKITDYFSLNFNTIFNSVSSSRAQGRAFVTDEKKSYFFNSGLSFKTQTYGAFTANVAHRNLKKPEIKISYHVGV